MPRRAYNDYPPEFKTRAIELCLRAIVMGWSVAKFAKRAGIWKSTMLTWMADDTVFDRYRRAMEIKSVDFPALHADVVRMLIEGVPVRGPDGHIEKDDKGRPVIQHIDAGRAAVALRSIEFRMQRELKRIYEPSQKVTHELGNMATMTDQELTERYERMKQKALAEGGKGQVIEGTARKV